MPSTEVPPPVTSGWRYTPTAGHFDEMIDASGSVRPHWGHFAERMSQFGTKELDRRWKSGKQLIHDNGVTYNVHGDESGLDRPWQLDPIPMLISADEWQTLASGIAQRGRLLNSILADLYGPQNLFRDRLLSPSLIHAQPGYLRAMRGIPVKNNAFLQIYGVDLARSPNGQWWVVSDRTQAPSGLGYVLENRLALQRTLPDVFNDCHVCRLAEFYGAVGETIAAASPGRGLPRVVLLTPGLFNETYFEHVYLARFFDYSLAEAKDLTVRDNRVFLKTLDGLLSVDVILRRTDDGFCDPLELREDSLIGVAGLVSAVRAGTVAVVNALGTSLAQIGGLSPFLPSLCRQIIGEDLLLPGVATWWCGQESPRDYVVDHIASLVIKPSVTGRGEPVFGHVLSPARRESLAADVRANAQDFIGQEQVRLSTAPALDGEELSSRHLMLRAYAVQLPDGEWRVMPGGLTRISASADSSLVSAQRGGGSKDTWVLSDRPVTAVTPIRPPGAAVEVTRAGFVLSSRVADNLYWLGRYVERIDFNVRITRLLTRAWLAGHQPPYAVELLDLPTSESGPARRFRLMSWPDRLIAQLVGEDRPEDNPRTSRHDVDQAVRLAATVRDRLSDDAWRIIRQLEDQLTRPQQQLSPGVLSDLLDDVMITLSAFAGQATEGLTHEKGWRFLDIGRRLERSVHLTKLLTWAGKADESQEAGHLEAALEIANSIMTYRSRYRTTVQPAPALDLLLRDETNPRSIAHSLVAILNHLEHLPHEQIAAGLSSEQRIMLSLTTSVRLILLETQEQSDERSALLGEESRSKVNVTLQELAIGLPNFSVALSRRYLTHALPHRQQSAIGPVVRPVH